MTKEISLIGSGSWATALAKIFVDSGVHLKWWVRSGQISEGLRQRGINPKYLSAVHFDPKKLSVTQDLKDLDTEFVVVATPSVYLHQTLQTAGESLRDRVIFSSIKGIVPQTHQIVGEYLQEHFDIPTHRLGVITGPCHAEEVSMERLSYLTIACQDMETARQMDGYMQAHHINTTLSQDVFGAEYGAVLKNVYAICSGMCHGLGYGDNFQAVLISNAIREMKTFISALHPMPREINESAYLGDLLVTAYSMFSRNRTFGNMIGKGYSIQSAKMQMSMIAEGYYGVKGLVHLLRRKKLSVHTPILTAVYEVLYRDMRVEEAIKKLTQNID